MTEPPIDLDGRRTVAARLEMGIRRRAANSGSSPDVCCTGQDAELDAALKAGPARSWTEAADKVRFLLDRFSAAPEARDARIQKLIGRAMGDLARLRKREEEAP